MLFGCLTCLYVCYLDDWNKFKWLLFFVYSIILSTLRGIWYRKYEKTGQFFHGKSVGNIFRKKRIPWKIRGKCIREKSMKPVGKVRISLETCGKLWEFADFPQNVLKIFKSVIPRISHDYFDRRLTSVGKSVRNFITRAPFYLGSNLWEIRGKWWFSIDFPRIWPWEFDCFIVVRDGSHKSPRSECSYQLWN